MIRNLSPEEGGTTVSKTLVTNHYTTWQNSSENHDLYFERVGNFIKSKFPR
jgi:hypothetical protein